MRIKEYLLHYTWDLAYGHFNSNNNVSKVSNSDIVFVKNPFKNKWFADPFILDEDEKELHLLVEEFDSTIKKGRIAHIVINKKQNIISDCTIILESDSHLSFPAIYYLDGKIFVHPENSASGKSIIYEYNQSADMLTNPREIISEPLTDAVIHKVDGYYELVSTMLPNPNGNTLFYYRSNDFWGPYSFSKKEILPSNTARMAGYFFNSLRPAQNCNGAYGRSVIFYKGQDIIYELKPHGIKYAGLHTFNSRDNTFVMDFKKYDFTFLYYLIQKIKRHKK